jgi:hypothetical protein
MTPKEKAKELFNRVYFRLPFRIDNTDKKLYAKMFALIAVNEIINALRKDVPIFELGKGFWKEVKQEIEWL